MKKLLAALLALLLLTGCQKTKTQAEITLPEPEAPPVTEETAAEPVTPKYLNLTVQALYEGLLDTDCPETQAEQIAAWLDEHPGYTDKVAGASCEYAIAENGIERVRFLIADSDRFSRYSDDASKTVVYQLWLVDGAVREGASGVLTPLEPDYLYEDHELAGFYIGQPTWEIDLHTLDGFYAVKSAQLTGFASQCDWCDEHYTNGPVTLCFITTGMEYLVHVHVQSGDADYLGVRLGDSVDDLIETMEKQKANGEYWVIYRERHEIVGYGLGINYAEQDGRITELELFAFV